MTMELLTSVIAGVIAMAFGILMNLFAEKRKNAFRLENKKIEDVLEATERKLEEARARFAESIVEKVPASASPEEIVSTLSSQMRVGGDVVINQIVKDGTDFIQELVNGYHHQALSQAKVQFWFSIIAATVGFGYILYSASDISLDQWSTALKILPGVVIDAVAALFFRQAEQTRQRATELYDRLRTDSQMSMARKLLESIEDKRIKALAQAQIALHMAGVQSKDIDIATLLSTSGEKEHQDG